jgi:hypothetical protein
MAQPSDAPAGAEAYPFDPSVRAEQQCDLERLRAIPDRKLAAYLFDLYVLAANNSAAAPRMATTPRQTPIESARTLARRALAGELGADARELAEVLLLDPTGRERGDDTSVRGFVKAFGELKRR